MPDFRYDRTRQAKYTQPCMAFCGKEILIGHWIDYTPNGWRHCNCEEPTSKLKPKTPEEKESAVEQAEYRRQMQERIEARRRNLRPGR